MKGMDESVFDHILHEPVNQLSVTTIKATGPTLYQYSISDLLVSMMFQNFMALQRRGQMG
jgi:hypothetical protein